MYISAYSTPLGSSFITNEIKDGILKTLMIGALDVKIDGKYYYGNTGVILIHPNILNIKPFSHPIEVVRGNDKYLAIDVRRCTKFNGMNNLVVTNIAEFTLQYNRARMQKAFAENPRNILSRMGTFPMLAHARWIAETLSRTLGLNSEDQFKISALAAYFFICSFDVEAYNPSKKTKDAVLIARTLRLPNDFVLNILSDVEKIETTEDFVSLIVEKLDNPRLRDFNVGSLYMFLSNGWLGMNYKDIISSGIDHVPTWLSIVFSALKDKGSSRTAIAKTIQNNAKGNNSESFVMNFINIVGGQ